MIVDIFILKYIYFNIPNEWITTNVRVNLATSEYWAMAVSQVNPHQSVLDDLI